MFKYGVFSGSYFPIFSQKKTPFDPIANDKTDSDIQISDIAIVDITVKITLETTIRK